MAFRRRKSEKKKRAATGQAEEWYADKFLEEHTKKLGTARHDTTGIGMEIGIGIDIGIDIEIGTASILGTRQTQQDTIFGYASGGNALAIVCDGMGGLAGGEIASRIALDSIADAWFAQPEPSDIPAFFRREAIRADENVFLQTDASGNPLRAGTTVVAVIIRGNQLYWLSVGDSKIYFIRGNEMLTLNAEHNYRLLLNARLKRGEITPEKYEAETYRAEALISYIGMGHVSLMDINKQAYPLIDGDIVLLSSDGLSRSLYEEEILAVIKKHSQNMQDAADACMAAVEGRKKQDNTSVVLLRYRNENLHQINRNLIGSTLAI